MSKYKGRKHRKSLYRLPEQVSSLVAAIVSQPPDDDLLLGYYIPLADAYRDAGDDLRADWVQHLIDRGIPLIPEKHPSWDRPITTPVIQQNRYANPSLVAADPWWSGHTVRSLRSLAGTGWWLDLQLYYRSTNIDEVNGRMRQTSRQYRYKHLTYLMTCLRWLPLYRVSLV